MKGTDSLDWAVQNRSPATSNSLTCEPAKPRKRKNLKGRLGTAKLSDLARPLCKLGKKKEKNMFSFDLPRKARIYLARLRPQIRMEVKWPCSCISIWHHLGIPLAISMIMKSFVKHANRQRQTCMVTEQCGKLLERIIKTSSLA